MTLIKRHLLTNLIYILLTNLIYILLLTNLIYILLPFLFTPFPIGALLSKFDG